MRRPMTVALIAIVIAAAGIVGIAIMQSDTQAPAVASELRQRALEHERLIAECMRGRGFDYEVALPRDVLLEEARAAAEAAGDDPVAAVENLELPDDPNTAIAAALSPSDQRAYEASYWGDGEQPGCYHATYKAAWGADLLAWEDALATSLDSIDAQIDADPEIQQARKELLACLDAAGYTFEYYIDYLRHPSTMTRQTLEAIGDDASPLPGGGAPADHPEWRAHEQRVAAFKQASAPCEEVYKATVTPIENRYVRDLHDDARR